MPPKAAWRLRSCWLFPRRRKQPRLSLLGRRFGGAGRGAALLLLLRLLLALLAGPGHAGIRAAARAGIGTHPGIGAAAGLSPGAAAGPRGAAASRGPACGA